MDVVCGWGDCHAVMESRPQLCEHFREVHQPELAQHCKLELNEKTGRQERFYKCQWRTNNEDYCIKTCSRLENFKSHVRTHTGDKPFSCKFEGCTKSFSSLCERIKHESRTHSKERPYVCDADDCEKSYKDPSALRKHMMASHGAEEYDQYKIRNATERKRKQLTEKKQFTVEEFSALQKLAQDFLKLQKHRPEPVVVEEQILEADMILVEEEQPYHACEFSNVQKATKALILTNHTPIQTPSSHNPFVMKLAYTKPREHTQNYDPQ